MSKQRGADEQLEALRREVKAAEYGRVEPPGRDKMLQALCEYYTSFPFDFSPPIKNLKHHKPLTHNDHVAMAAYERDCLKKSACIDNYYCRAHGLLDKDKEHAADQKVCASCGGACLGLFGLCRGVLGGLVGARRAWPCGWRYPFTAEHVPLCSFTHSRAPNTPNPLQARRPVGLFPKTYDDDRHMCLVKPEIKRLFLYMLSKKDPDQGIEFADSVKLLTAEKVTRVRACWCGDLPAVVVTRVLACLPVADDDTVDVVQHLTHACVVVLAGVEAPGSQAQA